MSKFAQVLVGLAAFGAAFLAGCRVTPAPPSVQPPREYQSCSQDTDCILVNSSCNGCCQREAVNRKDSLSFERYRSRECDGYDGGICDCCYYVAHAECKLGRCTQVVDSAKCGGP